ncbi:MAG: glycosyltransferase [Nitrosomonas ureae]
MHIALIPLVFLPKYTGGGEVWMSGIARELHSKGHKVSILTAEDSAFQISGSVSKVQSYDDEWEGLPVRRLYFDKISTGQPSPWYDTTNPSIAEAVTSFLMDCRPDVVHLTCGQHLSASPILAAQAIGLPTVLTLIGFWYICPLTTLLRPDGNLCPGRKTGIECLSCLASRSRNSRVLKQLPHKFRSLVSAVNLQTMLLARASVSLQLVRAVDQRDAVFTEALRGVDRILAPSTALRDIFVQSGIIGADQIMYWPYSIEVAYASQGSDKSPSNVLRIGYTGHMLRQKGVDVLIKAVRNLSLDIPLQLRLYGALDKDMEYGKELVALASNDPRILFLGRFDNRRIGEILREIDVVVVPSIWS